MYMQGNHIKKATALISPDDAVLYAVFYLSGRRGSRKRLQISSISPTSRGTMLRSLLFIWIGEFSIFYHSTIKKEKETYMWCQNVTHVLPYFAHFLIIPHSLFQKK